MINCRKYVKKALPVILVHIVICTSYNVWKMAVLGGEYFLSMCTNIFCLDLSDIFSYRALSRTNHDCRHLSLKQIFVSWNLQYVKLPSNKPKKARFYTPFLVSCLKTIVNVISIICESIVDRSSSYTVMQTDGNS